MKQLTIAVQSYFTFSCVTDTLMIITMNVNSGIWVSGFDLETLTLKWNMTTFNYPSLIQGKGSNIIFGV